MIVLNAGSYFSNPGSLNNGKQKTWHQPPATSICVPKKTLRAWLVINFRKFGSGVVDKTTWNSKEFL